MIYDYIIIGAGSAGCVLANRLSEDPTNQVLLVEAGGTDRNPLIHIPGAYLKLHHSAVDWNCFYTIPQPHLGGRRIYHPRGKVLGGSSSTNAMVYIRGQKEDFDHWEDLGNTGWNYQDVLPFFKRSEDNAQLNDAYHARGGWLPVTHSLNRKTPFASAFINACQEAGIPFNEDFNGKDQYGVGWFQHNIKNGKRMSAFQSFLAPVKRRKNLTFLTHARVSEILLKDDRAVGISILTGKNIREEILASKEVILSAGAFGSPHLLMLSGIGPPDGLKKAGIPVKIALEGVGQNLQDHLFFPVSSFSTQPRTNNYYLPLHRQFQAMVQYLLFKRGPLTLGPLEACAFVKSNPEFKRADIQLEFTPTHVGDDYTTDIFNQHTFPTTDGYTILPTQMRPESRGEVTLLNSNPHEPPRIDPRYLSSENDRALLVKGGQLSLDILNQQSFDPFRLRNHLKPRQKSEEEMFLHIQKSAECVYHPVGTCKMGTDEGAVVNSTLQVYGLPNLRVIDASIMPTLTSGNTNAPTVMIAEKGASFILQEKN